MGTSSNSFKNTPPHMDQAMQDDHKNKELPAAAKRALAEAEERRNSELEKTLSRPKEVLGRDGPEPTRYGDWEKDGIISDF